MGVTGAFDKSVIGEGSWSRVGFTDRREEARGEELRAASPLVDLVTISGVTEMVGTGRYISDSDLKNKKNCEISQNW